jgi:hypothetical protein
MKVEKQSCGECSHYAQGPTCSFCASPEQKDAKKKSYRYYSMGESCPLFLAGIHQSRIDYMKSLTPKK